MRGRLCIAAFAVSAVFAAPAEAGTITRDPDPPCCNAALTVRYTAADGELNSVTFTRLQLRTIEIEDVVPMTVAAGIVDCGNVTPTKVRCDNITFQGWNVFINLGDRDDTSSVTLVPNSVASYTVDGGPGNDTISGGDGHDVLSGGDGPDVLVGSTGNDVLNGNSGNDALFGTIGNDTLEGGSGDDAYAGGDGNDHLKNSYSSDDLNGNDGIDTVDYSVIGAAHDPSCLTPPPDCPIGVNVTFDGVQNDGSADLDMDLGSSPGDNVHDDIEVVVGTPHPDTLNGGSGLLNTTFSGVGGNDTITGGPGTADILVENAGGQSTGLTMTLGTSTLTGFFGSDTFTGVENFDLAGGAGNDTLNASAATAGVTLRGNANDTVIGGSGNDTIIDGALLTGGPGNDSINGGGGTNTLVETVDANMTLTNTALTGGLGTDTLANISKATLTGGAGNNTLNAGGFTNGPVTLDGGAGIDLLQGGSQADQLTGGPGNDTLDGGASNADALVETANANMTLASSSMTGVGSDSLANIEQATLNGGDSANVLNAAAFGGPVTVNGGAGADTITGGPLADTLNGGEDNDTVTGGDAMDILNGNGGADTLNGGLSLDVLNGGDGDDSLDGGADAVNDILDGDAGVNRVVASGDTNFTLTDTNLVGLGNDTLTEVTRATLTGGAGDNALNASAFTLGPVLLNGGSGADTLLGGSGGDTLTGGPALDAFDAGAGADTIQARDGVNESSIVCGTETDTAVVDVGDSPNADCDIEQLPDTKAPNTKLKKVPKATTKSRTATFGFTSTEVGSKFQCKLDKKAWASCKAPRIYKRLKKGKHTFQVRAIDKAGNRDKTPAKKTWRIT